MVLYMIQGHGVFASDHAEKLPTKVRVVSCEENLEVSLDGVASCVNDDSFEIPIALADGAHVIKVDGRVCEGVIVKKGMVRPAGEDFRRLIPAIFRLYDLDLRVRALEKKANEKQIDWLI